MTDVDTTGAVNNKILKYNGTSWVVADDATGGGGGSSYMDQNVTGTITTGGNVGDGFITVSWWGIDKKNI